jgi:hypothetical protein
MKRKLPLVDVWLISGRRLRAGYRKRYEWGWVDGAAATDMGPEVQAGAALDEPSDRLRQETAEVPDAA